MSTFYWHDYEAWGADPSIDRPSQFAGVRTDEQLNIISEPQVFYCQPPVDIWPCPEACLVTGITPQLAAEKGLPEREFIARIHREFSEPDTCVVGYNSIRFDDEITRYTLYRNFYDPYEREWKNGNSRWDILDMLRLCYATRPENIEWPIVDGRPSFKLENLTQANNIEHGAAHDAYSDVAATIALAKLVKQQKPRLYQYLFDLRDKRKAAALIDLVEKKPLLHVSSRFSAAYGCSALVAPLAMHPVNRNAVVVYDLSVDPSPLIDLTPQQIYERVFVSAQNLPEGEQRIPLKLVHLNKCPVLATPKLLDDRLAARLNINKAACEQHWQMLKAIDFRDKLNTLYLQATFPERSEPERRLYDGFLNDRDRALLESVRQADFNQPRGANFLFEDPRYQELLFRYRARNFPEGLSEPEQKQWQEYVAQRLIHGDEPQRSWQAITAEIAELMQRYQGQPSKLAILRALKDYIYGQAKTWRIH